ncbi:MAG: Txe/YoeB family addiction module toxin [Chlamydiae bacterium]|nr:MAG: Txe/YoeB family addiction module toxin [Chlamydiota bacterium]
MSWELIYTSQAKKDAKKLAASGLKRKAESLLEIIKEDPYKSPPEYKKLLGNFMGIFSRRINFQHRLVYQVLKKEKVVKILRLWSHYE